MVIFTFRIITQKVLVVQHWYTSHFKAVNLAVLISGRTCLWLFSQRSYSLWLFYVPRYRRLKMQLFFSRTNLANYLLNITHFYDHKKVILSEHPFFLFYWHGLAPLHKFWNEKKKKIDVWNILPINEKIPKWRPKNEKVKNLKTTLKFYVFTWIDSEPLSWE